jgi:Holliday junction resolvase
MTLHRRAARRDGNEAEIIKALESVGATVVKMSAEGVPDLLVGWRGITHLIEVKQAQDAKAKTQKGKATQAQKEFAMRWTGGPIHIVTTKADALRAIGAVVYGK